jgi:hypothetical protein
VPRKADFNRFSHAFDLVRVIAAKGRTRRLARPACVRAAGGGSGPALLTQPGERRRRRAAEETLWRPTQSTSGCDGRAWLSGQLPAGGRRPSGRSGVDTPPGGAREVGRHTARRSRRTRAAPVGGRRSSGCRGSPCVRSPSLSSTRGRASRFARPYELRLAHPKGGGPNKGRGGASQPRRVFEAFPKEPNRRGARRPVSLITLAVPGGFRCGELRPHVQAGAPSFGRADIAA